MIKGKTPFEAAGKMGKICLPCAPLAQGEQAREFVLDRDFLQHQVRQRSRGFPDRKARMGPAFEQERRISKPPGDHGDKRTTEAGSHYQDLNTTSAHVAPLQTEQWIDGRISWVRFIWHKRPRRCSKQCWHVE